MEEEVILVDQQDQEIGFMEKILAHKTGSLHRAISVLIFNSKGEMLLQQRSASKYHSPLLWTNACCSHPRKNETTIHAAERRLKEEMGLECALESKWSFIYHTPLENGLIEHEYDHVFIGYSDQLPVLNPEEANSYCYKTIIQLKEEINKSPEKFTVWFKIIFDSLKQQPLHVHGH